MEMSSFVFDHWISRAAFNHLHLSFPLLSHIKTIRDTVDSPVLTLCVLNILAQVVFTEANHSVSVFV